MYILTVYSVLEGSAYRHSHCLLA